MPTDDFRVLNRHKEAVEKGYHYPALERVSHPHLESFNQMLSLLDLAVQDIPHLFVFSSNQKIELWVSNVTIAKPMNVSLVYPAECRQRGMSYKAKMQAKLCWRVNDGPIMNQVKPLGQLPIMVGSQKCNLYNKTSQEKVDLHEDPGEFGGYFVSNGIDKLIRLLIVPRRNLPTAIVRPSFQNRGHAYSPYGVQIRSVRPDQTSQTVTMHYLTDGQVTIRFSYRKNEYMVPFMLVARALVDATDLEFFERLTMGQYSNTWVVDRVEMLLRSFRRYSCFNQSQALKYLGSKFAVMLDSPQDATEEEVGNDFLRRIILVHLQSNQSKFDLLIFMLIKLYSLVSGESAQDNPDSLQFQECLMPGHLYLAVIKEKVADWLEAIKMQFQTDIRRQPSTVDFQDGKYLTKALAKCSGAMDVGKKLEYFLATGNLVSKTGLDLQQVSGYTIVAEKLNYYRYLAHFRSIHRGSFFAELKTTTVRKLLPESWGFLCPVHTPDGSPCGLLNHLSHTCEISVQSLNVSKIPSLVHSLGANAIGVHGAKQRDTHEKTSPEEILDRKKETVYILLDGRVIGWCSAKKAQSIAQTLREYKVTKTKGVPLQLEIGYVPPSLNGQFPGLYLFSNPARFVRRVRYLKTGTEDYVGPFEQVYMDIACLDEDIHEKTTHQEYEPTDMLSYIASLTPFSDFNQSPRNMYQCQMGKQAMGTPCHNLSRRTDNKMYRLQTGQTPIVRPKLHDEFDMDSYPNGMNAVVCVISYTGYDMEDASIISKYAHERGYGYGDVFKGEWVDLSDKRVRGEPISHFFGYVNDKGHNLLGKNQEKVMDFLDTDGLPYVGQRLVTGDPYYCYYDTITNRVKVVHYKGMETCYIDQVRLIGTDEDSQPLQKIHIKIRIPRPPVIGDKFSSRHGQKGVISQKWPTQDMPFSESGIIPDVIINPHAFPSRMTIGMFVESVAGKAGALHGIAQDATPFQFSEDEHAADYFGEQLRKAGFNYYGNEPMYSGITGEKFKADIYLGVVYYQRLRHMVSDKYQVRTTGPVDQLTQQPIKGRKRMGGIRFGEMERDSLLAHGVSFLLQDRLMNCSDYTQAHICTKCGSILSPLSTPDGIQCRECTKGSIDIVAIPYVFRYLVTELVSMNIKLKLEAK
ncbi:hypothetical protein EDD86DRAFT_197201 [Gorgonomyces haynaldii]|nr:hypothetical protein EDD86DRAFT_197201 [Gorgonomyces haynaldii]